MKKLRNIFLFVPLFAFLLLSCSGDDSDEGTITETGPDFAISELAGSWNATQLVFTPGDPNSPFDQASIIEEGGSASMVIQPSGSFSLTINPVDRDAYIVTGKMFFEDNKWFSIEYSDSPGDWETYGATLTSTTFTINGGPNSAEYDFDNNGTSEISSLYMVSGKI